MKGETLVKWFDPNNLDHIRAYNHLSIYGVWPVGFMPEDMFIENNWQMMIAFKLAQAWVGFKLDGE